MLTPRRIAASASALALTLALAGTLTGLAVPAGAAPRPDAAGIGTADSAPGLTNPGLTNPGPASPVRAKAAKTVSTSATRTIARQGKPITFRAEFPRATGQMGKSARLVVERRVTAKQGTEFAWKPIARLRAELVGRSGRFVAKLTRSFSARGYLRAHFEITVTEPDAAASPTPAPTPTSPAPSPTDGSPVPPEAGETPTPGSPSEPGDGSASGSAPAASPEPASPSPANQAADAVPAANRTVPANRAAADAVPAPSALAKATATLASEPVAYQVVGRKVMALTFDDGPKWENTPEVLDILKRYNARATFFLVCYMLGYPSNTGYAKRTIAEGHELASHRWDHSVPSPSLSAATFTGMLDKCEDIFAKNLGYTLTAFRFPWGASTAAQRAEVRARGMRVWGWTYGPGDGGIHGPLTKATTDMIANGVLGAARDGAVILLHDVPDHPNTVAALPRILRTLKARGYDLVTVDDLAALGYKVP